MLQCYVGNREEFMKLMNAAKCTDYTWRGSEPLDATVWDKWGSSRGMIVTLEDSKCMHANVNPHAVETEGLA